MEQKKIRVYHFVRDQKFIDGPIQQFDSDGRFENDCFMLVDTPDYKFKYIKNTHRIKLIYNKKALKEILNGDYDAIFFFSLPSYKIFNYIPKDKIVIWWAWGYDLYGNDRFISIPLYKPLTKKIMRTRPQTIIKKIADRLKEIPFIIDLKRGSRRKAIRRIDYFQPVLHCEYEMMKQVKGFNAKEFYYPGASSLIEYSNNKNKNGNILVGNSASMTNNHLDVWDKIEEYVPFDKTAIFPVNYGDMVYAKQVSTIIGQTTRHVRFLTNYLDAKEYYAILDSCSFAVFGVLRQEAMGNIFYCLARGIKVFLFEDSVPYNYLKSNGCYIYSIDSMNKDSFKIPLTDEEAYHNYEVLKDIFELKGVTSENAIGSIQKQLS